MGWLGVLIVTCMAAGCGGGGGGGSVSSGGPGGGGGVPGGGVPGGGGGGSFTSTAFVTNRGVPQGGVAVTLSRDADGNGSPDDVVKTVTTDSEGKAVFTGLTPGTFMCYSATIASENRRFCSNRDERTIQFRFGE
jgi:hypothetical protein